MATLIWSYVGPRSAGIAEHYGRHLREFADREGLASVSVDVVVNAEARTAEVTMVLEDADRDAVVRALRPHRVEA